MFQGGTDLSRNSLEDARNAPLAFLFGARVFPGCGPRLV